MWTEDIRSILEDADVATGGEDLFFSTLPSPSAYLPSGYINVIETPGSPGEFVHNQNTPRFEKPRAQVVGVATTYAMARLRAQAAYDALKGKYNVDINGTFYRAIRLLQPPAEGGVDARGKATVKFNIEGDKRP